MPALTAFTDHYGLALSTSSSVAAERYVEAIELDHSGNLGAEERLVDAIQADEGFALPHAALARIHQFRGNVADAKASAERASALSGGISRRERQHVEAIAAMAGGEMERAKGLLREHVAEFPRDAQCLGMAMFILPGGESDARAKRRAFLQQYADAYGDDWWFLGTLGMAMEEDDRLAEARHLTERSLALYPRNGSAAHWLAHVYYETNDHGAGRDFLAGWMAPYPPGAPHHCHFLWHLALFEITSGHYRRALDLFEHGISSADTARTQPQDAASLLWRCQLYGYAPAPLSWDTVQVIVARQAAPQRMAFGAAHAALAYAGAGDLAALDELERTLRDLAAQGNELAGSVTAPLVAGIAAFARGDYDGAVRLLTPIIGEIVRISGSNAQREVFEETLLEALLRSDRYDAAEALLRRRLGRRESGRDYFRLSRVHVGRGDEEQAQASRAAGVRLWPSADADAPELAAGANGAPAGAAGPEGRHAGA